MTTPARAPARELVESLARSKEILILPHDNPDPDALAASAGLRALLRRELAVTPRIVRSGLIGRAENRALVAAARIPLVPVERALAGFEGALVLVDSQPGRANNALPPRRAPVAVIDHHPDWGGNGGVAFLDLREGYGATSTIVTEYLQELEVPIDARLATALFYGIASETRSLGRETQSADIVASQFLYPYVDKRLLGRIETPVLPPGYFELMAQAVYGTLRCEDVVITLLPELPYPDAVAEVADLLVRLEGATWAACLGLHDHSLYVSLRSNDRDARAGLLLASLLPARRAGGHGMIAGGRLPLGKRSFEAQAFRLTRDMVDALGRKASAAVPLAEAGGESASAGMAARLAVALAGRRVS